MTKVSGVDFSNTSLIRETVSIKLMDGKVYELPLIPVKRAEEGETLLRRNSLLASRYVGIQVKLNRRAKLLDELKAKLDDEPEKLNDLNDDSQIDAFDDTYKLMGELQKQTADICKESNALCAEIREFMDEFVDKVVTDQLAELEDKWTITVLELMLYGEDAMKQESEGKEENPTTQVSQ